MVIGKMVHDALEERVRQIVRTQDALQCMYQPQAHVSAAEHEAGLNRLRTMVERYGRRP